MAGRPLVVLSHVQQPDAVGHHGGVHVGKSVSHTFSAPWLAVHYSRSCGRPRSEDKTIGQQENAWLGRPISLWQPGESCLLIEAMRGLHLNLRKQQQVPYVPA